MDANGDGEMDSQDPLHGLTLDLRPIGCQCLPGNIPGNHPISPISESQLMCQDDQDVKKTPALRTIGSCWFLGKFLVVFCGVSDV